MAGLLSNHSGGRIQAARWLEGLIGNISFRRRLLRMALRRIDNIPAAVVMALETAD